VTFSGVRLADSPAPRIGAVTLEEAVAEVLAALAVGERLAHERAQKTVALAPDDGRRKQQQHVADREGASSALVEARARELGPARLQDRFEPFFRAFFDHTVPVDWLEAQVFQYVGDSLVKDLTDALAPMMDPVSAEVVRSSLSDRDEQDAFSLDEITRGMEEDGEAGDRIGAYARRVIGEALTQTRRALDVTDAVQTLLQGEEGEKRLLLDLLDRHRVRLDRLGIEPVEE
jgi:tRNA-(MS[2]IO[6]A)-hydroxylase (MiaE)-like